MLQEVRQARRVVIVAALVLAVTGWAVSPAEAATESSTVTSGEVRIRCRITVGGSFHAVTTALSGTLERSTENAASYSAALRVDLATLETGIGLRDTHLRERHLEIERGIEFRYAALTGVELDAPLPPRGDRHKTTFTGTLSLHGVERAIGGEAELRRRDGGLRVEAVFPLSLDAFDIPPPRHMGVGVRDEITVTVSFVAAASDEVPPNDGAP